MKYFRIVLLIGIFFVGSYSLLSAEQITTVAIIDISKVMAAFPGDARGYESLNRLRDKYQKEIDEQISNLDLLKREKALALEDENYDKAKDLDKKITNFASYIDTISQQRQQELVKLSKSPISKKFLEKLQDAISYVAEEKGYTLVLQNTTSGIQWWAPVIDITDDVIARLKH